MILKVFTYGQYIKCIHTFRLNAVMQLAEESTEYRLEQEKKKYSHDKLIKGILQDTKEVTEFINQFVEPREEIKEEELVRYTNSYITKKYKAKEADLVYKLKNQEVFFLIEHQSTIDYNMSYRMLNYCLDIMRERSRNQKIGKNIRYPIIIPILIYTGNKKWKMPKNFSEKQINNGVFERYKISFEYNFINISKFSEQYLLKKDTMLCYAMFLEKAENDEQLINYLEKIINSIQKKKNLEELYCIIRYLFDRTLEDNAQEELLKKIEIKVGEEKMSVFGERLARGIENFKEEARKEGKEEGKEESQRKIAENMLNLKLDEKLILKTTQIKKADLEKIKKELATIN